MHRYFLLVRRHLVFLTHAGRRLVVNKLLLVLVILSESIGVDLIGLLQKLGYCLRIRLLNDVVLLDQRLQLVQILIRSKQFRTYLLQSLP